VAANFCWAMTAVVVPAEVSLFLASLEPPDAPALDAVPPAVASPPAAHPDNAINTESAAGTRKVRDRFDRVEDMVEGVSLAREVSARAERPAPPCEPIPDENRPRADGAAAGAIDQPFRAARQWTDPAKVSQAAIAAGISPDVPALTINKVCGSSLKACSLAAMIIRAGEADTIVAGGARSALPHAQPTAARLETGGLVVVDMGAMVDGYASDMTRMLFVGTPGTKVKRAYRAVLEAQLAAIATVRDGASTAKVDAAARRVLRAYGLERAFVHSTGHGLGLEIHEPPRLGRHDKARLKTGMTVTVEPGVYLEGFGGIRIEDTVLVTGGGCEILTPTAKELRTV